MSGVKRNYARMLRSGKNLPPPLQSPFKQYSFDRPYPQRFSLPYPMVIYMIEQHKPVDLHEKFIQLCKYTFAKNRVVPVSKLNYVQLKTKPHYWTANWNGIGRKKGRIDLNKGNFKLWIVKDDFKITIPNVASKLASRTYRCDANVRIENQNISFEDFKKLTSGPIHSLVLRDNVIKYSDGSIVPFEYILENLIHVTSFPYKFSPAENDASLRTSQNHKNIIDVLSRPDCQIRHFMIYGLTETFDLDLFTPFLMNNQRMKIIIGFSGELSDSYKAKLEALIDKVLQTFSPQDSPVYRCPYFGYNGISEEHKKKLKRVRGGPSAFSKTVTRSFFLQ